MDLSLNNLSILARGIGQKVIGIFRHLLSEDGTGLLLEDLNNLLLEQEN